VPGHFPRFESLLSVLTLCPLAVQPEISSSCPRGSSPVHLPKRGVTPEQDAVGDGRLRPQCRHLMISTKQHCLMSDWYCLLANYTKHSGPFTPLYENMMSSTKPEIHNVAYSIAVGEGPSHGNRSDVRKI